MTQTERAALAEIIELLPAIKKLLAGEKKQAKHKEEKGGQTD